MAYQNNLIVYLQKELEPETSKLLIPVQFDHSCDDNVRRPTLNRGIYCSSESVFFSHVGCWSSVIILEMLF